MGGVDPGSDAIDFDRSGSGQQYTVGSLLARFLVLSLMSPHPDAVTYLEGVWHHRAVQLFLVGGGQRFLNFLLDYL